MKLSAPVYRLKRKITSHMYFCRPAYASVPASAPAAPAHGPVSAPPALKVVGTVSVAALKRARYADPPKAGTPLGPDANQVYTLEKALERTMWIRPGAVDGHYGSSTVGDGSSGYGGTTGFQRKHSGARNPDGWLGKRELRLLFDLANMAVKIVD